MNTSGQAVDLPQGLKLRSAVPVVAGPRASFSDGPYKVGFWIVAAWVFISFSRFFDLIAVGYKIPGIVYYTMVGVILISGAIPRALHSPITWMIVVFTIWVGITLPFSVWRTNSIQPATAAFQSLVTFVAISGLTLSPRQCIRMIYILGAAAFVGAILSFAFGNMETGRLELMQGSFKDPNEYAMTLLMGLPLLALLARSSNPFTRIFGAAASLVTLFVFLRRLARRNDRAAGHGSGPVLGSLTGQEDHGGCWRRRCFDHRTCRAAGISSAALLHLLHRGRVGSHERG